MRFVVNNAQMKAAERLCDSLGTSYNEMMSSAGGAIAERIAAEHKPCRAVILCGAGNNGGDGFVIAARLLEKGFGVRVILVNGAPKTDCAMTFFGELPKSAVFDYSEDKARCAAICENSDIAVDCVFGTGFHGALPEAAARLFSAVGHCPVRISADVPSGMNSDTGEYDERMFRPTKTYVLAALKKGLISPAALEVLGEHELLDIGIGEECFTEYEAKLTEDSARAVLPKRAATSHKGTFGRLLNIAGSLMYSGAAVMSTNAALRSGAGLCTLAAPTSTVKALAGRLVENTFLPLPETPDGFVGGGAEAAIDELLPKMTAVSIGCGLGNSENTRALTEFVVKNARCPIIIDADGINSLRGNIMILKERTGDTVISPHPLEFSRISGLSVEEIRRDRVGAAKGFAAEYGVVVLLKGAYTVVTDGREVFVNPTGNGCLAKGGSGDVLTGIIAAMLAQGVEPLTAAASGAYCHGCAADITAEIYAPASVIARDVIEALPRVFI